MIVAHPHRYDEKYKKLVEHVEKCCVRLGELLPDGSIFVYSPFWEKKEEIDLKKFLNDKNPRFFTIHGNVAIRELDQEKAKDRKIIEDLKKLPEVWRR